MSKHNSFFQQSQARMYPVRRWQRRLGWCSLVLLLALLAPTLAVWAAEPPVFITKWGSTGSGDGQFDAPNGVAVNSSGNVYVVDAGNNRIQVFTSSGSFVTKWGSHGSGDGQFDAPLGMAVDSSGNVYVVDSNNHRIQKFTSSGSFVTKWGSQGSGDGQFSLPQGVAVDSSGYIYVSDYGNDRIQKFTSGGSFVTKWGSHGSGDGQFIIADGVAVDSSGNVYVVDSFNSRIQVFTSSGSFVTKWGTLGSSDGQFRTPDGVAVDSSGNVYVADRGNSRIQVFTSSGSFVTKWGTLGSGDGQFRNQYGVAVDSSGNVYVSDFFNSRIQKFAPVGLRNSSVSQTSVNASYNATLQPCGSAGNLAYHTVISTLRNISANAFANLYFKVKTLEYIANQGGQTPKLCNAATHGDGVGGKVSVPNSNLPGSDSQYNPGEDFLPAFQVGLPVRAAYRFFVDLYSTGVAAAQTPSESQAGEYLGSFAYEVDANGQLVGSQHTLFLPIIGR